jgi:hypothetical protein
MAWTKQSAPTSPAWEGQNPYAPEFGLYYELVTQAYNDLPDSYTYENIGGSIWIEQAPRELNEWL